MEEKLTEKIKASASLYSEKSEYGEILRPFNYEDREYFVLEYDKVQLFVRTKKVQGRLVIDGYGDVIDEKGVLNELGRLLYYYDVFFRNRGIQFKKAVKRDEEMESEMNDYIQAKAALDYLSAKDVYEAGEIKVIFENYPKMKKESNDILKELIDKINKYDMDGTPFSEHLLDELFPYYEKVMITNFERIKYVNSAAQYYDAVLDQTVKMKRAAGIRMNMKNKNIAFKLESILQFYVNLLKFYGDFLNYSTERYKQFVLNKDKSNIDEYINSFRNFNEPVKKIK